MATWGGMWLWLPLPLLAWAALATSVEQEQPSDTCLLQTRRVEQHQLPENMTWPVIPNLGPFNKYFWPRQAKGNPALDHFFASAGNEQRGIKKHERIVIVGGGPSGVHMSKLLVDHGYTSVTVLEAEREVGGKSYTEWSHYQPGVPHDMGTCYLHQAYFQIRELLQEYDPENLEISFSGEDLREIEGEAVRVQRIGQPWENSQAYQQWVLDEAKWQLFPGQTLPQKLARRLIPQELMQLPMLHAMTRYLDLHLKIFGEYEYGLPPKPKPGMDGLINMTAMEFINKHSLKALIGIFRYGQQVQGYGVLETIPAFYLCWWSHPDMIRAGLRGMLQFDTPEERHDGVEMLKYGYQRLWTKIRDAYARRVSYVLGAAVASVVRHASPTGPDGRLVSITYTDSASGASATIGADKVIMAVDMSRFLGLISEPGPKETAIFPRMVESTLATTLYKSNHTRPEVAVEIWLAQMRSGPAEDGIEGHLHAVRNSRMAVRQEMPPTPGLELRVGFQFMDRRPNASDPDTLLETFKKDMPRLAGEPVDEVILQKPWAYFPRFDQRGLNDGLPWDILSRQGLHNTFYIGSSASFESVLDVVQYNKMIIQIISGHRS